MASAALAELAQRDQWVAWKLVARPDEPKPTKIPYSARTGRKASTTEPATWASHAAACKFCEQHDWLSGIGYVLSQTDPYVGVDLDNCRDPHSGRIEAWAKRIMKLLDSYTEISPSGTGIRIFVKGELPPHGRKKANVEMYSQARFMTITGDSIGGFPDTIEERRIEVLQVHREVFGEPPGAKANGTVNRSPIQLADADLLLKARAAENGGKFWALWNGDYSSYPSQSEADLALVNLLAFWTGPDEARIDQLFRSSGLMREKWDREDYRAETIGTALEDKTEFYGDLKPGPKLGATTADGSTEAAEHDYRLIQIAQVMTSEERSVGQLLEGLIWKKRVHWIFADAGSGKTMWTLAQHLHIAAGRPFLGRAVQQGPVVLIEEDSPLDTAIEYAETLADIYDIALEQIPFFMNDLQGLRLTDDQGITRARLAIAACPEKPVAVILDAAERLVPSEKFTSRELDAFDRFLKGLINDDIVPTVIDHINRRGRGEEGKKPAKKPDPLSLLYGGQSKHAISDVMVFLDGKMREEAVNASWQKFRVSGAAPPPFTIRFDDDKGFLFNEHRQQPTTEAQRAVMRHLEIYKDWRTGPQIVAATGLPERRAQRAVNALITQRWVEADGSTKARRYRTREDQEVTFQ